LSPLNQAIQQKMSASASLDQQRRAAQAERIMGVQREFDVAMKLLRDRRAAEARAHREALSEIQQQIDAAIALEEQKQRAYAEVAQRTRAMVAQSPSIGAVTMLNSPAARVQAAQFAAQRAAAGGGDQAVASRAAAEAVARLNAMQLASTG